MDIKSIRYGFANNSSSSHSIVFLGNKKVENSNVDSDGFGWDFFTAASEETKKIIYYLQFYINEKLFHISQKLL